VNGAHSMVAHPGDSKEVYKLKRHNATDEHEVLVRDVRTLPGGLAAQNLNTHGFCLIPAPSTAWVDFDNKEAVEREYYPAVIELAKKYTGATRGFVQGSNVRVEPGARGAGGGTQSLVMSYALFAHSDAGPGVVGGWRRFLVKNGVPEEEAKSCDVAMFNFWHPFDRPAYKDPLCFLDATSREGGLRTQLPEDGTFPGTVRYNQVIMHPKGWVPRNRDYALGPQFVSTDRWVYCSDQTPEEAWLFKQYDTREGVAKMTFHTSFHDPFYDDSVPDKPGRRSSEVRLFLVFPKDQKETTPARL